MTRRVTGTLIGPTGTAVASATLRFQALATSAGGVPQGVSADTTTNEAGVYDATLQAGEYRIFLSRGTVTTPLGNVVVTDGSSITLPGLLAAQTLPESTAENLISRVEALEEIPPGSGIEEVVAGTNVTVDNTNPLRPVVSAEVEGGAVDSVNGQTGTVVLDAGDVGADPAGSAATATSTAAAALTTHANLTTSAHGGIVASNDSRLTNARTPTAHASSHASAGSDPITPGSIGAATASDLSTHTSATTGAHNMPDPTTIVTSVTVAIIRALTQAEYDLLTPSATTLYVIIPE